MKAHSRAFTLIELLVVIAIVGILMGLLFPTLNRARHSAREKSCANHLRQLHLALMHYSRVYDGRFPVEPTEHNPHPHLVDALTREVGDALLPCFYCPEGVMMEPYARDTVRYLPTGQGDSVLDTPENRAAGNIGYVYWSFEENKPGWRNPTIFKPRILRDGKVFYLHPDDVGKDFSVSDTWLMTCFFRRKAPFPHGRSHAQGVNVLFLDGHITMVIGRPRDNYK